MGWFITTCIVGLLAVVSFGLARKWRRASNDPNHGTGTRDEYRALSTGGKIVGYILAGVSVLILVLSSFTIVPTRNEGVEVSVGHTVGTLEPGMHLIYPWASVDNWDSSIQTLHYDGGKGDGSEPQLNLRLKNLTIATANVTVQWQLDPKADIQALYKSWRSFDKIQKNVIDNFLQTALNEVTETYDPLSTITGDGTQLIQPSDLAKTALPKLQAMLPTGILITSLNMPSITFPPVVQDNINKIITAAAATKAAEQQKVTAQAIADAAKLLAADGNLTWLVLYQNCLSMVERIEDAGHTLPAGFTCGAPPTTVVPAQ